MRNPPDDKGAGRVGRRGFLKRGLIGGVLLSAAGGLGLWPSAAGVAPRQALLVLGERHFAILAAIAARTVTAPGADPVAIAHGVDATLARSPREVQDDFLRLLLVFEGALTGLLLDGRIGPFTRLSPEAQDAALEAWRDSRLVLRRTGYIALKKLTIAAYYATPESWAGVKYPGPPPITGG